MTYVMVLIAILFAIIVTGIYLYAKKVFGAVSLVANKELEVKNEVSKEPLADLVSDNNSKLSKSE
jgi:hypothetical protein